MKSEVAALQQLLEVYEQTVLEKSRHLEQTLEELAVTNQRLRSEIRERTRAQAALRQAHGVLEQRVAERTAELTQANQELESFARVASHDLQEPLRKIEAFGSRLAARYQQALDEDGREMLARMMNAARRLRGLIHDLLTLSRVTKRSASVTSVELGAVVREVLGDLEVRIQETRAQVEVASLPSIEADPTQMRQLLQNLIGNALKFHNHHRRPLIRIRAELHSVPAADGHHGDGGACHLIVEDNGIGFESRYAELIFEAFQRLHGRHQYEGSGIGLTLCRKIAERHGGTITARGIPGEGSVFRVTLPVRQSRETVAGDRPGDKPGSPQR